MVALIALLAAADGPALMAVLELQNRLPAAERESVDRAYFSDRIRRAALHAKPGLRLMTRENMEVLAKSQGIDLAQCDQECEIETGRKLGADLLVSGDIARVGAQYKLSLRMHDTQKAQLLSLGQASGATVDALDKDLDQAMRELFGPLTGIRIDVPEDRRSFVDWMWARDRLMVWGSISNVLASGARPAVPGNRLGARIFGIELRYETNTVGDMPALLPQGNVLANGSESAFGIGLSPISLGLDRDGPHRFSLTYFEPFFLWQSGHADVKSPTGVSSGADFSGAQIGTRLFVGWNITSGLELRLGGQVGMYAAGYACAQGVTTQGQCEIYHVSGVALEGFAGIGYGTPGP